MKSTVRVASPPDKPVVIYDGDCRFCVQWVRRWEGITGPRVDYAPFQEPGLAERFPELPRAQLETAIHLIAEDGSIFSGAEAVLRALARHSPEHWLLDWYDHSPAFARAAEAAYSFIARHRTFLSGLTRLAWGAQTGPSEHILTRWVFLRAIGLIYLAAFLSLQTQITGLVGADGILPAKLTMAALRQQMDAGRIGADRYRIFPTFCWFNASDGFLKLQCLAGVVLAAVLIIGIAPAPCLFLLWLIYLSLTAVCRDFLGFQWDNLLLETGFLAIFLAPLQLWHSRSAPPSRIALWLLRWLLFRLMFESGCVKLLSGDPAWRDLTALKYHYETQPLPTWVGWYASQLPLWFQKISAAAMFGIELGVPFLMFAPRRLRYFSCAATLTLQVFIFLTGNYCFFNLLTVALCLLLLDDATFRKLMPAKWRVLGVEREKMTPQTPVSILPGAQGQTPAPSPQSLDPRRPPPARIKWPRAVMAPLACVILLISIMQFCAMFRLKLPWPRPLITIFTRLAPLRSFNRYGLFAVMTTSRLEIVVEGSNDGLTWLPYEFKYKPGDVRRRPKFVEPHQPRLDWQMWFAALGTYQQNPWLINVCVRLLQGSPSALALLGHNPFPAAPPLYVRGVAYDYHFTDLATRRRTGAWWRRTRRGDYLPVLSLGPTPGD